MKRRVVITGLGPITAAGSGWRNLWSAIREGRGGVGALTRFDGSAYHARCAGEVKDWDARDFFTANRLRRLDHYARLALGSALMALEDAGLPWSRGQKQDCVGVSFGTALGGIAGAEEEHAIFLTKGARAVNQLLALQIFGGSAHSNIAMECGFRGPGTTNSNTCASGVIAIGEALRYIRDGWADVMIAGGAEAPLCPLTFGAFDFIKTMSRSKEEPARAYRPFDLHRDGFIMGEGAASVVLEELSHAERRGATIYAEVSGYALNNEAYHMTTPDPSGEMVRRCMASALADADLPPEAIDYINGHASGTQLNDLNETAAVKAVFGAQALRLAFSGTKPFTGHPLGATGAIETVITALALREGFLPPTLNYATPDPRCDLDVVPRQGRPAKLRAAVNNAFGFGGINASLILKRTE